MQRHLDYDRRRLLNSFERLKAPTEIPVISQTWGLIGFRIKLEPGIHPL
jgi:hypothetical protein